MYYTISGVQETSSFQINMLPIIAVFYSLFCSCSRSHKHTQPHTHNHTHTNTQMNTHTHTHTNTGTHTLTLTYTHEKTNKPNLAQPQRHKLHQQWTPIIANVLRLMFCINTMEINGCP